MKKSITISLKNLFVHFWDKGGFIGHFHVLKTPAYFKNDPCLLCKDQICEHEELKDFTPMPSVSCVFRAS